jgi:hypothetical protein
MKIGIFLIRLIFLKAKGNISSFQPALADIFPKGRKLLIKLLGNFPLRIYVQI